jgi:hypothetical protein
MNQATPDTPLRDVLYAFALAKATPDADLLEEYVRLYPNYAAALTSFAIEMIVDSGKGNTDQSPELGAPTMTPTVSRVMSRFHNRLNTTHRSGSAAAGHGSAPVANPFATLDRKAFRDLARNLNANAVFVAKLRDREIDVDTMTDGFRQRIAEQTHAPLDLVMAHFAASSEIRPGQFYKAEDKPAAITKQTFREAVATSGLTEEQQRYLLSL